MLAKVIRIARTSLPRIDDLIRSALTACLAGGLYVGASLVPATLHKPAGLVAHTFAVVAVYSLINTTYSRVMTHAIQWVKCRLGLRPTAAPQDPLT